MDRTVNVNGTFEDASPQALLVLLRAIDDMDEKEITRIIRWVTGQDDFPGNSDYWIGMYANVAQERKKKEK